MAASTSLSRNGEPLEGRGEAARCPAPRNCPADDARAVCEALDAAPQPAHASASSRQHLRRICDATSVIPTARLRRPGLPARLHYPTSRPKPSNSFSRSLPHRTLHVENLLHAVFHLAGHTGDSLPAAAPGPLQKLPHLRARLDQRVRVLCAAEGDAPAPRVVHEGHVPVLGRADLVLEALHQQSPAPRPASKVPEFDSSRRVRHYPRKNRSEPLAAAGGS